MAEGLAIWEAWSDGAVEAFSAGSHPKPLHPHAVRVMREEYGIDLAAQTSKPLGMFIGQSFDWVISLCDRVREVCPKFPGHPEAAHWSIPNPTDGDPEDVDAYPRFQRTAAELAARVEFLLVALAHRTPAPTSLGDGQ